MAGTSATGVPDTFLLAPGGFEGELTAGEVAAALRRGLAASGQQAESMPLDGRGVPTLLVPPLGLEQHIARVGGPPGRAGDAASGSGPRGVAAVLEGLGYDAAMRRAIAVITGEARLDRRSLAGGLVGEVATRARQAGVPCHAVVGHNDLSPFESRILDLQLVIEARTVAEIEAAGARIGAEVAAQRALGR